MEGSKIVLELTLSEAKVIKYMIQNSTPKQEDEMITLMLYARITRKIEELNE